MSNRLPILAGIANAAHERAGDALRTAAAAAREAGDALLEAKAAVGHGGWAEWLKANFRGGSRTAQRYMRIARNWPTIAAKTSCMSDLSVNAALDLLDGRDELERALVLQAEMDALQHEADFLRTAVETADVDELRFIINRCQEIFCLAGVRGRAVRETGRLMRKLGVEADDKIPMQPPENFGEYLMRTGKIQLPASFAEYLVLAIKAIDPRIELLPSGMKLPDDLTFEQWQAVLRVLPPVADGGPR